ncbi:MAG: hypothetical protein GWO20_09910, partial [Candidatus Korarchaeota archaeon]|nr:hypothetical protein [Candidatus Korarchaeota archaeon]NIU83794.1 hypothetical protein [Candidatus Thorarchaeota archaeon]NIW13978.1 hypothetical protein [Candidatus Thorarchaeota archaeon]NIW52115.1 hypothetical protein [Candidatus Korarchaeota archaeon]
FLILRKDFLYGSVGIWVLLGVIIDRLTSATRYPVIVVVATLGIIIVVEMVFLLVGREEKVFPVL